MNFTSYHFILFFIVTLAGACILKDSRKKIFLLLASYYFYGVFSLFYLSLLIVTTLVDYIAALGMGASDELTAEMSDAGGADTGKGRPRAKWFLTMLGRRGWLIASLAANLGVLGFFKYTNFALDVFRDLGVSGLTGVSLQILLPAGISFYTFQSISYTIDVYRRVQKPRKNPVEFALFVAFYPQLVAGPIVRSTTFLSQMDEGRSVKRDDMIVGMTRILTGYFQKLVLSDNIAPMVNQVFASQSSLHPLDIWIGAVGWGFQIYFDFAGYTDIARGVGRLFGFEFETNFDHPMAAKNIQEHWARWHISLITWFRDYVYIPLGGSRLGLYRTYFNSFIVWFLAGLWHGAGYTFVLSGIWQWVMLTSHNLYSRTSLSVWLNAKGGIPYNIFARFLTIFFLMFGWIYFRSETLSAATQMQGRLFGIYDLWYLLGAGFSPIYAGDWSAVSFAFSGGPGFAYPAPVYVLYLPILAVCFVYDYAFRYYPIEKFYGDSSRIKLAILLSALLLAILVFAVPDGAVFIYFQF